MSYMYVHKIGEKEHIETLLFFRRSTCIYVSVLLLGLM